MTNKFNSVARKPSLMCCMVSFYVGKSAYFNFTADSPLFIRFPRDVFEGVEIDIIRYLLFQVGAKWRF